MPGHITVRRGDTLSRIAREHHTTVAELVRANNITDPNRIYEGQRLVIPGAQDSFEVADATEVASAAPVEEAPRESWGELVVKAARDRAEMFGANYAVDAKLLSPNPDLAFNRKPDVYGVGGTMGRWKCNQFGGDVLYQAGFEPPMYSKPGYYVIAEEWPNYTKGPNQLFELIKDPADAQPGDVLIADHPGSGAEGGHVRILTSGIDSDGGFSAISAHYDGAYESRENYESLLRTEEGLYILRPIKRRVED
jgi:LysM repeat protein